MRKLKITFNAPVTLGFVFICFVVTLLGVLTGGGSIRLLFMTYHSSLTNPLTYLRFFTTCIRACRMESFYRKCLLSVIAWTDVRRKIWFERNVGSDRCNSTCDRYCELHLFLECSTLWSEWCRICIYRAGVLYRIPSRRNSVILYSGCDHLYRTAGI